MRYSGWLFWAEIRTSRQGSNKGQLVFPVNRMESLLPTQTTGTHLLTPVTPPFDGTMEGSYGGHRSLTAATHIFAATSVFEGGDPSLRPILISPGLDVHLGPDYQSCELSAPPARGG